MSDVLSWIRSPGPFLIGHRGHPFAARENTPGSFEAALEAGCDGVEFDVRMTRDGVLVVHHDETAYGSDGPLRIDEVDWSRLHGERFRAGVGGAAAAPDDSAYQVSSLEDVLGMLSGRCLINVEMKPPGPGQHEDAGDLLLGALETVRPRESVLVSSFDPEMLAALRRRDSAVSLGYLFSSLADFNHLDEEEIAGELQALHPLHGLVDEKLMKRIAERGLQIHAWTVDDPAETTRLIRLGVTSVITNRPEATGGALYAEALED